MVCLLLRVADLCILVTCRPCRLEPSLFALHLSKVIRIWRHREENYSLMVLGLRLLAWMIP